MNLSVVCLAWLGVMVKANSTTDINMGVIMPFTGAERMVLTAAGAAYIALEDIEKIPYLLNNKNIVLRWIDSGCNEGKGLSAVVDYVIEKTKNVHTFIGGVCDIVCEPVGLLASHWNLLMISWGCSSSRFRSKSEFPTFARTVGSYTKLGPVMTVAARRFGWDQVGLIVSSEEVWQLTAHEIKLKVEKEGILVNTYHVFDPGSLDISSMERHSDLLLSVSKESRVIILCAYGGDIRELMLDAFDLGLINGEYVFFTVSTSASAQYGRNTWMGEDGRDAHAAHAFTAMLNFHLHKPESVGYKDFEYRVRQRMALPPFNHTLEPHEKVDVHAAMLYDAVMVYAYALHDALEDGHHIKDGATIAKYIFNRTFPGIAGPIRFDEHGDRNPDYSLQYFDGKDFQEFADYHFSDGSFVVRDDAPIFFAGGKPFPPKDHPECGWEGELCAQSEASPDTIMFVGIGLAVLILLLFCLAAFLYRKSKNDASSTESMWRVHYDDLAFIEGKHTKSFASRSTNMASHSDSTFNKGSVTSTVSDVNDKAVLTSVARYKGTVVAIKRISKTHLDLNKVVIMELKQMFEMSNENMNPFVGACVDPPNVCLVSQYCTRGSLQDVLENDDIQINNEFKMSFAMDICKGMEFIHRSSLKSHGRLKSSNCLIDNRWSCKISDYGLATFRKIKNDVGEGESNEYRRYAALLWTAPELLRRPNPPPYGTTKGDVFSFSIILQEILTRSGPYVSLNNMEPKDIIKMVQGGLEPPFRPIIPTTACKYEMRMLLESCWDENPDKRPSFMEIRKRLKIVNGGKAVNIMDNMLKMMEQYANNLEELVNERTKELEEEKRKTDLLLYQMLPKSVAEALKTGKNIPPEAFPNATIYFSDIVGFTKIASESSPLQVVDFLNELYTTFDAIIDNYDVYKVETIGDAYMVASGVPVSNGIRHASEIATLALDILSALKHFRIKHQPKKQLQLRIGIHSGPVVAGVVGLKMPRYCLFGDTVNMASRMESNGFALRIHVSGTTRDILEKTGGFRLDERGLIEIKGKGEVMTYWLKGKAGFNKPLPDPQLAVGVEEHEFK